MRIKPATFIFNKSLPKSIIKFDIMKWPPLLLLIFIFLLTQDCLSQQSFLFLKKHGHKKRTWVEGDIIRLRLVNDDVLEGRILLLRNDSIFINDLAFRTGDVRQVLLKRKEKKPFPVDAVQMLYITGGVALATIGMKASGWETTGRALLYSSIIGYGPILITAISRNLNLRRKHFDIGKKFRLQVLDFYVPQKSDKRAF
jgi:hypothetical protein